MSGIYKKKGKELKIRFIVSMTEKDRRQKIISKETWQTSPLPGAWKNIWEQKFNPGGQSSGQYAACCFFHSMGTG